MKKLKLIILIIIPLLNGCASKGTFNVSSESMMETLPAVAYKSKTKELLVAYLEEQKNIVGRPLECPMEVRVKRLDSKNVQQGNVLYPFGSGGSHKALDRPAIAYNPKSNTLIIAVVEKLKTHDRVLARPLDAKGKSLCCPGFIFDNGMFYHHRGIPADSGHFLLDVTYNSILGEFVVTSLRRRMQKKTGWRNGVWAQRFNSKGLMGKTEILYETKGNIDSHGFAHAPISGAKPNDGRYLLDNGLHVQLFNSKLKPILVSANDPKYRPGKLTSSVIVVNRGQPGGSFAHSAVAYGEVADKKRFLIVYADQDNCWLGKSICKDSKDQWHGIWGAYVDPEQLFYSGKPNFKEGDGHNSPFPISFIDINTAYKHEYHPDVSYHPDSKAFLTVWREISANHPDNKIKLSLIRVERG